MSSIGICMGGLEAVEFLESLPDIIPSVAKTAKFNESYDRAMNRVKYEVAKGIGKPMGITPAVKAWHKDIPKCGHCGAGVSEVVWKYCPNCGTAILERSGYTSQKYKDAQITIFDWLERLDDSKGAAL